MPSLTGTLTPAPVKLEQFLKLTTFPIVIYYGDNIPATEHENPGAGHDKLKHKPSAGLCIDSYRLKRFTSGTISFCVIFPSD